MVLDVLIASSMGRKNEPNNATSLVDQYRKQLGRFDVRNSECVLMPLFFVAGRQEKKVVNERRRDIKRLKSEQADVSYWKVRFHLIKNNDENFILSENYMGTCCCVISGLYYLCFINVLFNSKRSILRRMLKKRTDLTF